MEEQPQPNWLDTLYGTLFQPHATFARLADSPPLTLGLGVYLAAAAVNAVVTARMVPGAWDLDWLPLPLDPGPLAVAVTGFGFWVSLVAFFVTAATIHLTADLLGGRGRGAALVALLGLAHLPKTLNAPLALLEWSAGVPVLTGLGLAVEVWRFYLYYRAVRAVSGLPRGRALIAWASPFLLVLLLLLALVFLTAALAVQVLPYLEDLPLP